MGWIAVAAGGALGALLRSFIYELFALTERPGFYALPTLVVNVIGSFIIGIGFYLLVEHAMLPPPWKNFIVTGFLGALTTFSTFSLDSFRMIQSGLWVQALVYCIVSVVSCILLTWAGYALTARLMS